MKRLERMQEFYFMLENWHERSGGWKRTKLVDHIAMWETIKDIIQHVMLDKWKPLEECVCRM